MGLYPDAGTVVGVVNLEINIYEEYCVSSTLRNSHESYQGLYICCIVELQKNA